jgi:hypothetical protein
MSPGRGATRTNDGGDADMTNTNDTDEQRRRDVVVVLWRGIYETGCITSCCCLVTLKRILCDTVTV